ncbi:autotransporter-associated beta strand repeat-containing protein [Luteolibacter pohnpeiensis]|nr:autotransporter-associated beta strand repeat-containing protein [Luteolibacter pohnpeiensis]
MPAGAVDQVWTGATASFADASLWTGDGQIPGSGDNAFVNNGGTVQIGASDPAWSLTDLRAGESLDSSGTYMQSGGTVTAVGWLRLGFGNGATGSYTLSGGTLNLANRAYLGAKDGSQSAGGNGILTITGGVLNHTASGQYITVGSRNTGDYGHLATTGKILQSGGTLNVSGQLFIGNGSAGSDTLAGTYELSGNGALNISNWFVLGRGGSMGQMEMSGGTVVKTGTSTSVILGISSTGRGTLNQTGGVFTNTESPTWFGESGGSGYWNLSGDAEAVLGNVYLAQSATSTGEFNLNGGTLSLIHFDPAVSDPAGTTYSKVLFNGGTLKARADDGNFLPISVTTAEIASGGAVVDSDGFDITFDQALTSTGGDGGLIKKGAGTLLLNGENAYSGMTSATQGELILNGSIDAPAPPSDYHGTIGEFSCASLTFSAAARMLVEIDSSGVLADHVSVAGNVELGNAELVVSDVANEVLPPGTRLELIKYEGNLTGAFSNAADGADLTIGSNTFKVNYHDTSAVTLTIPGEVGISLEDWLSEKIADESQRDLMADPDRDGRENLLEFALDGDPMSATDDGKMTMSVASPESSANAVMLTLPVRTGAQFSGTGPMTSLPVDGLSYIIEASTDLVDFTSLGIHEVGVLSTDGMPDLSAGWNYRRFVVSSSPDTPSPRQFMRVRVIRANAQ